MVLECSYLARLDYFYPLLTGKHEKQSEEKKKKKLDNQGDHMLRHVAGQNTEGKAGYDVKLLCGWTV